MKFKMNKEQEFYVKAGLGFGVMSILLICFLSLFKITQEYIGVTTTVFICILIITSIHIWIFKDDKKTKEIEQLKKSIKSRG